MLNDLQIAKLQTIYKNRFGTELSRDEAYDKGVKLLRLFQLVYKPITKEQLEKFLNSKANHESK